MKPFLFFLILSLNVFAEHTTPSMIVPDAQKKTRPAAVPFAMPNITLTYNGKASREGSLTIAEIRANDMCMRVLLDNVKTSLAATSEFGRTVKKHSNGKSGEGQIFIDVRTSPYEDKKGMPPLCGKYYVGMGGTIQVHTVTGPVGGEPWLFELILATEDAIATPESISRRLSKALMPNSDNCTKSENKCVFIGKSKTQELEELVEKDTFFKGIK